MNISELKEALDELVGQLETNLQDEPDLKSRTKLIEDSRQSVRKIAMVAAVTIDNKQANWFMPLSWRKRRCHQIEKSVLAKISKLGE